jgi:hypothetical protein
MIILREPGELEHFVLLELQGELQFNENQSEGIKIGDLKTVNNVDYTLEISGKQRISGKKVKLVKPLALIMHESSENISLDRRLITEKIMFNSRPMAIL